MPYEITAECPCCRKQARGLDQLKGLFGTRVMENNKIIPQSYCRACRIAHCTAGKPCKVKK